VFAVATAVCPLLALLLAVELLNRVLRRDRAASSIEMVSGTGPRPPETGAEQRLLTAANLSGQR
jgi:hypothetical protein